MLQKKTKRKPTRTGYIRFKINKKNVLEHRFVWESAFGKLDPKIELHHINGDKTDNRLENLEPLDRRTHIRKHFGFMVEGGTWVKTCRDCGIKKNITLFPANGGARCCKCNSLRVCEIRRRRLSNAQ